MGKKLLAGLLTGVLLISLVGCGKKQPVVPASTSTLPSETMPAVPSSGPKGTPDAEKKDYLTRRIEAEAALDTIMDEKLPELLDRAALIQSEEMLDRWFEDFKALKEGVSGVSKELTDLIAEASEAEMETQNKLTIAAAAIEDALSRFEDAVQTAVSGNSEAFAEAAEQFAEELNQAKQLWAEARK